MMSVSLGTGPGATAARFYRQIEGEYLTRNNPPRPS